ncbi:MAG: hypothetical protein ACYTDT_00590 [Planctomycetota bacterium]|jgi:hypothetical protein
MMRYFWTFALLLILAGCTTTEAPTNSGTANGGDNNGVKYARTAEEAEQFVRRYPALSTGLVNYFNPADVELLERRFSGETIVFRLDNTGDGGILYTAAIERAAEFAEEYHWPQEDMNYESPGATEYHVALVRFESMSIPAGAQAGDTIPVKIILQGDASDIRGGYIYPTPMRNKAGKTVGFFKKGYLPFNPDKYGEGELTEEQIEDARNLTKIEAPGRTTFILRDTVTLAAEVTIDDLSSDQIILPLMRDVEVWDKDRYVSRRVRTLSADLVPDVLAEIIKGMKKEGFEVEAQQIGDKLVVTPTGIHEETLRQIKEKLESLRVTVAPKNNVVIVFDENKGQISVFGPARHRFLYGDVFLTTDPFTRNRKGKKQHSLKFRLSCRIVERAEPGKTRKYGHDDGSGEPVDGHPGKTKLSWTRYNQKNEVVEERVDLLDTTDVSDILRHLWTCGISPYGALAFVFEAKSNLALTAELGLNYRKVDFDALRDNE